MRTYDPHKSTTEVRQGSRRLMNMRVLVTSGAILILLFTAIYLIYSWFSA